MLRPCSACRRHVSIAARLCTFCGQPLLASGPRALFVHTGRASRAMIFAGAIAVAPLACSQVHYETIPPSSGATAITGQVRGRVVRHDGTPAASHPVNLYGDKLRAATGSDSLTVQADASGHFVFDGISPGEYHIATHGLGDRTRVEVRAGQAAVLTLELEPPPKVDPRHMAKPYGAPPARRRIV